MVDLFTQQIVWHTFFVIFLIACTLIIRRAGKRYLFFLLLGTLLGFFFDYVSVTFGYYSYVYDIYFFSIFNVPVTLPLMEGMAIVLVFYIYEKIILPRIKRRRQYAG